MAVGHIDPRKPWDPEYAPAQAQKAQDHKAGRPAALPAIQTSVEGEEGALNLNLAGTNFKASVEDGFNPAYGYLMEAMRDHGGPAVDVDAIRECIDEGRFFARACSSLTNCAGGWRSSADPPQDSDGDDHSVVLQRIICDAPTRGRCPNCQQKRAWCDRGAPMYQRYRQLAKAVPGMTVARTVLTLPSQTYGEVVWDRKGLTKAANTFAKALIVAAASDYKTFLKISHDLGMLTPDGRSDWSDPDAEAYEPGKARKLFDRLEAETFQDEDGKPLDVQYGAEATVHWNSSKHPHRILEHIELLAINLVRIEGQTPCHQPGLVRVTQQDRGSHEAPDDPFDTVQSVLEIDADPLTPQTREPSQPEPSPGGQVEGREDGDSRDDDGGPEAVYMAVEGASSTARGSSGFYLQSEVLAWLKRFWGEVYHDQLGFAPPTDCLPVLDYEYHQLETPTPDDEGDANQDRIADSEAWRQFAHRVRYITRAHAWDLHDKVDFVDQEAGTVAYEDGGEYALQAVLDGLQRIQGKPSRMNDTARYGILADILWKRTQREIGLPELTTPELRERALNEATDEDESSSQCSECGRTMVDVRWRYNRAEAEDLYYLVEGRDRPPPGEGTDG